MKNHLQFGLSICENYKKYAYVEYFGEIICNPTVAHAAIATMWQRRNATAAVHNAAEWPPYRVGSCCCPGAKIKREKYQICNQFMQLFIYSYFLVGHSELLAAWVAGVRLLETGEAFQRSK